jgi:integrase
MPKQAKQLSAIEISRKTEPGMYAVGTVPGLYLRVKDTHTRQWKLRTMIGGRRGDIGLGGYPAVTLAMATEKARQARELVAQGTDPRAKRKLAKAHIEWTFDRAASEYIELHRAAWKNAKHAAQWVSTLEHYASPVIGFKHVRDVTVSDVLSIIEPHWTTKNETMVRLRNRIELVLSWAAARGYRDKVNPAAWKANLEHTLPKPGKVNKRKHHRALPHQQINALWQRLEAVEGMSSAALRFTILTACRSGEARGATWAEVDLDAGVWIVPAERMKAAREHRVPLSPEALILLQSLPRFEVQDDEQDLVFPGRSGKPLSDMSMTAVLRRLKVDAVPHGFRSSFADWAAETSYPHEIRELALAHSIGDKTVTAYTRTDLMQRRRQMMTDWAGYVTTQSSASVTSIKRKAA